MTQALREVNIELVNNWQDSHGIQHGDVTIGGLNFSLQFPWPFDISGTIQLPSNHKFPIPDIGDFSGRLTNQVGINGSLPPFHLVGLGNFGLSMETFLLSFKEGNVSSIKMVFIIPEWNALKQFQFNIVQPKLNVRLDFLNRTFTVKAKGFMVSNLEIDPQWNKTGLPIELVFSESIGGSLEIHIADKNATMEFNFLMPLPFCSHKCRDARSNQSHFSKHYSFKIAFACSCWTF